MTHAGDQISRTNVASRTVSLTMAAGVRSREARPSSRSKVSTHSTQQHTWKQPVTGVWERESPVASNKVTLKTGAWLYGVHRTGAETAAASRGTGHITTKQRCKYTTTVHVQKLPLKSYSHLFRIAPIRQESSEYSTAGKSDIKASRILSNMSQNWHRYNTKTGMIQNTDLMQNTSMIQNPKHIQIQTTLIIPQGTILLWS